MFLDFVVESTWPHLISLKDINFFLMQLHLVLGPSVFQLCGFQLCAISKSSQNIQFLLRTLMLLYHCHKLVYYSQVPIKRVGPNKRVGWIFFVNFIKKMG